MDISEKERVREATDLVQLVSETVQLKQRGREFWGCCPFHDEKTPSFHVSSETGLWHCFGCGEGGDVFAYVEKHDNVSFVEALRFLADRAGIELHYLDRAQKGPKRLDILAALDETQKFYQAQLMRSTSQDAEAARAYFKARGLGSEAARTWGLGFAPGHGLLTRHLREKGFEKDVLLASDVCVERAGRLYDRFYNRVMFTITNEQGKVIGFGGRVMDDGKPKYINSKDSVVWHKSKNLFGLDQAKQAISQKKRVIVCEGYTDTIALHQAGFTEAVAVLGTALTQDHIALLSRFKPEKIVLLLDGDAAGQRAQEKAVQFIDKIQAELVSVTLPNNMDPEEFLKANGSEALQNLIDTANPLLDDVLARRLFSVNLANPGQKVHALSGLAQVLAPLSDSPALDIYATQIADYLAMDVAHVKKAIGEAEPLLGVSKAPAKANAPLEQVSEASSPRVSFEQGICYIGLMHPELIARFAQEIQALTFENAAYMATVGAFLALGPNATPAETMVKAREIIPDIERYMAVPPHAYDPQNPQLALELLITNHKLLDTQDNLRRTRAELSRVAETDTKAQIELMQRVAKAQQELVMLQKELDRLGT